MRWICGSCGFKNPSVSVVTCHDCDTVYGTKNPLRLKSAIFSNTDINIGNEFEPVVQTEAVQSEGQKFDFFKFTCILCLWFGIVVVGSVFSFFVWLFWKAFFG